MIRPEEIRQKASNLYPAWQTAWLNGEQFFPRVISFGKQLDDNLVAAIESIQRLRSGSKEQIGYGYSVEWAERNSRRHGRNLFPVRIVFQTAEDFLQLIGKQREFATFTAAVEEIRGRFPQLGPWIQSHRAELIEAASELTGLLGAIDYFLTHPRPNLFARELQIPVDTKFIERNHRILRAWLDLLLPPHTIRADEDHFARRFGLRYADLLIFVRFLDADLQELSRWPWNGCAVPLHSLARSPMESDRVLIVENKVNLLTLPPLVGAIAMGGLGNAVSDLRYLTWLGEKELWYWGDIDVEGFEILSRLRAAFPKTHSFLMDESIVVEWREAIGTQGSGRRPSIPPSLDTTETSAFEICLSQNLRIEQERIPQRFVQDRITQLIENC